MAVIAAWRTGFAPLLTAFPRKARVRGIGGLVKRLGRGAFGFASKELAFAQAELSLQLIDLGLKFGETEASALVHAPPVPRLLAEFEVFGDQRTDVQLGRWRGRRGGGG